MKEWTVLLLLVVFAVGGFPRVVVPAEKGAETSSSAMDIDSVEKRRVLFSLHQERDKMQSEFDKKNQILELKEIELKTLEGEVDKKLAQLQAVRDQLRRFLDQKDEVEVQRIQELSKMYEKMDSAKGAVLLAELNQELAVQILAGMKSKSAGQLLGNMPPEIATDLSTAYSTLVED
jgi:flagellar motility protein MotE (MotC chaperone)